ncbi:MAG: DUF4040 domain-containing protein, partial [Actinobacteria bacterium]|nr:DUF4040 domain-containing protein [Actinomycetota bacterium]
DSLPLADSPVQAVLAVACGALGVGVLTARRRFTGALLLGGSGYALALVFLAHGAPDLAITQFLVETLVIVMFLLVLQHLPDGLRPPPSWAPRALRFGLAAVVGISVTVFALAVSSSRTEPSVGRDYIARSVDEGGGRNVVNVTLVDFRGFDTLGEITVLAVAAIGVVNLVGHARREQRRKRLADGTDDLGPGRPTVVDHDVGSRFRSVILSTTVRGIAPALGAVALFVAARGHNAPGGGFAGGLILATAIALGYLADGRRAFRLRPAQPLLAVGIGLALAVAVAVTPLAFGGALLESAIVTVDVPAVGPVKLVSSALFDVGVMILVAGAVLAAMAAFVGAGGADPDPDPGSTGGAVDSMDPADAVGEVR